MHRTAGVRVHRSGAGQADSSRDAPAAGLPQLAVACTVAGRGPAAGGAGIKAASSWLAGFLLHRLGGAQRACDLAIAARVAPDTEVPMASVSSLAGSLPLSGVPAMSRSTTARPINLLEIAAILAAAALQLTATLLWLHDLG